MMHSQQLQSPQPARRLYLSGWFRYRIMSRFLAPYDEDQLLLDVGGGNGNVSAQYLSKVRAIVVLDIDRDALLKIHNGSMWSVVGDARHLPFRNGSFQRALSMDFQEHLDIAEIPIYLKEIRRVMSEFAILSVFTSCKGFTIRRWLYSWSGKKPKGDLDWSDWAQDGHRNRLRASQHRQMVTESGFRLDRWRFASHLFDPLVRRIHWGIKYLVYRLLRHPGDLETVEDDYRAGSPNAIVEIYFWLLKWIAYLDCMLLGWFPGGSVFMRLVKDDRP